MSAFLLQFVHGLFQGSENALRQRRTSVETTLKRNWNETETKLTCIWNEAEMKQKQAWENAETGWNRTETVLKENSLITNQRASLQFSRHSFTLWKCAETTLNQCRNNSETAVKESHWLTSSRFCFRAVSDLPISDLFQSCFIPLSRLSAMFLFPICFLFSFISVSFQIHLIASTHYNCSYVLVHCVSSNWL